MQAQTPESFWQRVDVRAMDACWPWLGCTNSTGYGSVGWDGTLHAAHRVAAWLFGLVPSCEAPLDRQRGGFVLHTCDNRRCCNPAHFEVGTYAKNQGDAYARKRRTQPKGEQSVNAKLTLVQALRLYNEYARGGVRQVDLAHKYGVSQAAVSKIVRGGTYQCA